MKILNRKSLYSSLSDIDTQIIKLENRFDNLNIKYFENALINNNELIRELWSDYNSYTKNRAKICLV